MIVWQYHLGITQDLGKGEIDLHTFTMLESLEEEEEIAKVLTSEKELAETLIPEKKITQQITKKQIQKKPDPKVPDITREENNALTIREQQELFDQDPNKIRRLLEDPDLKITKEQFKEMSISELNDLNRRNPALFEELSKEY